MASMLVGHKELIDQIRKSGLRTWINILIPDSYFIIMNLVYNYFTFTLSDLDQIYRDMILCGSVSNFKP